MSELLQLAGHLPDDCIRVVPLGVTLEPDLPAGLLAGEHHLACTDQKPKVTIARNLNDSVPPGHENFQQSLSGNC